MGSAHNLVLQSNGTVVAWGYNSAGQCNVPFGLTNVIAIAAGGAHNLTVKADSTVVAWGAGATNSGYGQSTIPAGLSNVIAVAAGGEHSLALKADGTLVGWGRNNYGQGGAPAGLNNIVAIAAGLDHNLALKADGTVVAWGYHYYGQTNVPLGLVNVRSIAAGTYHSLALRSDGTVVAWGAGTTNSGFYPNYGQAAVPSDLAGIRAITVGRFHSVALRTNGTVVAWGDNYGGSTNLPWGLTNVVAIASGYQMNLAVTDGSPFFSSEPRGVVAYAGQSLNLNVAVEGLPPLHYQWQFAGTNIDGATDPWLFLPNVQLSDTGNYAVTVTNPYGTISGSLRLTVSNSPPIILTQPKSQLAGTWWDASFRVWATGSKPLYYQWRRDGANLLGADGPSLQFTNLQVTDSGSYDVVVSNAFGSTISSNAVLTVLHSDVVAWGDNYSGQTSVPPGLTNVIAISAGGAHALALKHDGTVMAWGNNDFWQTNVPAGLSNVTAVAAGGTHSLALKGDGTVVAWGGSSTALTNIPTGLTNAVGIAAGYFHCMALKGDGRVVAWGSSSQTNVPSGLMDVVTISAGWYPSLALKSDGTVAEWGISADVPVGLGNVVALAAGYSHAVVLKSDGTIATWGRNYLQPVSQPVGLDDVVAIAAGGEYFGVHSLALRRDGTVIAWGYNADGQTNVPAGLKNVFAVAAGERFSMALVSPNTLSVGVVSASKHGDGFSVAVPTISGRVYGLEFSDSLSPAVWMAAPLVAGNGKLHVLTDPEATVSQRFYRVLRW